jgi:hypothetical protein
LITSSNGFQPVLRGCKTEKDDQLSEGNDCRILVAFRFPRRSNLAAKDDIHREVLRRRHFTRYRRGQASL